MTFRCKKKKFQKFKIIKKTWIELSSVFSFFQIKVKGSLLEDLQILGSNNAIWIFLEANCPKSL
ncbi:hypothetical protein EGI22_09295 [Lacihabitans sp. LS3-19]|nr:hypothetical protein [Lacihabitans sp. LS3-19]